jgi:hypothetical protein
MFGGLRVDIQFLQNLRPDAAARQQHADQQVAGVGIRLTQPNDERIGMRQRPPGMVAVTVIAGN